MADFKILGVFSGKSAQYVDLSASGNAIHVDDIRLGTGTGVLLSDSSATVNLSGADKVGVTAQNYTNAGYDASGGGNLQELLDAIESALATAGSTTFDDAEFKIIDSAGDSLGLVFDVSAVTTADKTITMPDANVDLGDIALNNAKRHDAATLNAGSTTQQSLSLSGQEISANLATGSTAGVMSAADKTKLDGIEAGADVTDATNVAAAGATMDSDTSLVGNGYFLDEDTMASDDATKVPSQQSVKAYADTKLALAGGTMTGAIAMGTNKITGLGAGTLSTDAVNKSQLDAVEALINGLEWQDSAKDYIVDNTLAPPTEVSGDRYILSHDGGAPNAAWDGASAGDIVEFNGTSWVVTAPATGMFISVDDDATLLYYWGGSAWTAKNFEKTTASTGLTLSGLDVQLADAALASGIQVSSGVISIGLATDPGLEFNSGGLRAKIKASSGLVRDADGLSVTLGDFSTTDLAEGTNQYYTATRAQDDTIVVTRNAATGGVTAGDVVYVNASGDVAPAIGSSLSTSKSIIGVALDTATVGNPCRVATAGTATVAASAAGAAVAGDPAYITVDDTTGGQEGTITTLNTGNEAVGSGDVVVEVGKMITSTLMLINIQSAVEIQ